MTFRNLCTHCEVEDIVFIVMWQARSAEITYRRRKRHQTQMELLTERGLDVNSRKARSALRAGYLQFHIGFMLDINNKSKQYKTRQHALPHSVTPRLSPQWQHEISQHTTSSPANRRPLLSCSRDENPYVKHFAHHRHLCDWVSCFNELVLVPC